MDEIREKVRAFLSKYIRQAFGDQDQLFELGLFNSLFAMQLVTHLEKAYGIEVHNDDLEIDNFKSVEAICAFVTKKTSSLRKSG